MGNQGQEVVNNIQANPRAEVEKRVQNTEKNIGRNRK